MVILGLVYANPINQHPGRELEMLPVDAPKVGRYSQVYDHILIKKDCELEMVSESRVIYHWFHWYWSRADFNRWVSSHSSTVDFPHWFVVVSPSNVPLVTRFILEAID